MADAIAIEKDEKDELKSLRKENARLKKELAASRAEVVRMREQFGVES